MLLSLLLLSRLILGKQLWLLRELRVLFVLIVFAALMSKVLFWAEDEEGVTADEVVVLVVVPPAILMAPADRLLLSLSLLLV